MTVGRIIKDRRLALGMEQEDLAQWVGVTVTTVSRWENNRHEPALSDAERICDCLDLDLYELLGKRPIRQDLSGVWTAMWQTTRGGIETIDRHEIEAKFASRYVLFTATSGYPWRGDFRHDEETLRGDYRSTEDGRQASGVMFFRLNHTGDTGVGYWVGTNADGPMRFGWGCIARDSDKAEHGIKHLIDHEEPLTEFPKELL